MGGGAFVFPGRSTALVAVAALLFSFIFAGETEAESYLPLCGYVDSEWVFSNSDIIGRVKKGPQKISAEKQKELDAIQERLSDLGRRLRGNAGEPNRLPSEEREKLRKELDRENERLKAIIMVEEERKKFFASGWEQRTRKAIEDSVKEIAMEKGLVGIFEKSAMVYADSSIDISGQVLEHLNETTKAWFVE